MSLWETATLPLAGYRNAPFVAEIEVTGHDLTDAAFAMQIRDERTPTATLRADLATVTTAVEGVRVASVATVGGVTTSVVAIRIDQATMAAMDVAEDRGQPGTDQDIFYDVLLTPDGGDPFVAWAGSFTIMAQATNP